MFSFLQRELPAHGRVFYRGSIPPPLDQVSALRSVTSNTVKTSEGELWVVEATHHSWGAAEIACQRSTVGIPVALIDHSVTLTDEEREHARLGAAHITVRVRAQHAHVLRARKLLLFWLKALMDDDGVLAVDDSSMLLWSRAMLEDEVAHDADLDIEALYSLHAVQDDNDKERVSWLHTHGLDEVGAFDVDILAPSPFFVSNCADPIRAVAFAALEGRVDPATANFQLAHPHGAVRFVPVEAFEKQAAPEHRALRDSDEAHRGNRAVLCEPAGGLFSFRRTPRPSTFLSTIDNDGFVLPFSSEASALMAERARKTIAVFRNLLHEFQGLGLTAAVKLAYAVDGGGPDDQEHLWFEVHEVGAESIDATLANTPHRVAALKAGDRGAHDIARLSDWTILSPFGAMTPRNTSAARRFRAIRPAWEAALAAAAKGNV